MFLAFVEDDCWNDILDELSSTNVISSNDIITELIRNDPGKIPDLTNSAIVFNLSSPILTGYRLSALLNYNDPIRMQVFNYDASGMPPWAQTAMPYPEMNEEDISRRFDVYYAQTIQSDPEAFAQLFSIIYTLYNGADCYVLVGKDGQYKRMITDSIMKFIQQKYEISPIAYIACLEDYLSYDKNTNFGLNGIYNIDAEKDNYVMSVVNFNKLDTDE